MLSQMSQDDLQTLGASVGMGDTIDNWESMCYIHSSVNSVANSAANGTATINALQPLSLGNGILNNAPFPLNIPVTTGTITVSASIGTTLTFTTIPTGVLVGQIVTGDGVSPNTFVIAVTNTTVILNQAANLPSAGTVYFYNSTCINGGD